MSTLARTPPLVLRARLGDLGREYGAPTLLLLLVAVNAAVTPGFATTGTFWNVLYQVSPVVLVSVGMTLVLATNGIDLSVGSVMAVASAAAVLAAPLGALAAVSAGLAAGTAFGAFNGVLVTRGRIEPFLATLATQIAGRGLAQALTQGCEVTPSSAPTFEFLGRGSIGAVPIPVLLAALAVASALFIVTAMRFGRCLVAVGGNEAAARLAGIDVRRTRLTAYTLSGLLAGLAGLVETARLGAVDANNVGAGIEFAAIFGAVLGGTPLFGGRARVFGTAVGVLLLAILGASFNMLAVPYAWALIVQAAVVLFAVAIQRPRPR
jgi:galactofuranose transport system permease protein